MADISDLSEVNYRTQGREVDVTEIEKTKILAEEETNRRVIEEKEKTKRTAIESQGVHGYVWPRIAAALAVAVFPIAVGASFEKYLDVKYGAIPACMDKVLESSNSVRLCTHPLHMLTTEGKEHVCKCAMKVLPPEPAPAAK